MKVFIPESIIIYGSIQYNDFIVYNSDLYGIQCNYELSTDIHLYTINNIEKQNINIPKLRINKQYIGCFQKSYKFWNIILEVIIYMNRSYSCNGITIQHISTNLIDSQKECDLLTLCVIECYNNLYTLNLSKKKKMQIAYKLSKKYKEPTKYDYYSLFNEGLFRIKHNNRLSIRPIQNKNRFIVYYIVQNNIDILDKHLLNERISNQFQNEDSELEIIYDLWNMTYTNILFKKVINNSLKVYLMDTYANILCESHKQALYICNLLKEIRIESYIIHI
tara:strand:+ start:228 stop:1058 length:831 start_codon:yes stop_codon:yes gene_type:complete